jgi:hypothetical protein
MKHRWLEAEPYMKSKPELEQFYRRHFHIQ